MRNGIYTEYQGYHLSINTIRDDDKSVLISYKGEFNPFINFDVSKFEENTYFRIMKIADLKNAYSVNTVGIYRGFMLKVFSVSNNQDDIVRLTTSDKNAFLVLNLREVNIDWYIKDVNENELEEIWEERFPAFNLPMPEGLDKIKIIKPRIS